jgi:hypothetical protein
LIDDLRDKTEKLKLTNADLESSIKSEENIVNNLGHLITQVNQHTYNVNEYDKILTRLKDLTQFLQQNSEKRLRKFTVKEEHQSKLENVTKSKVNMEEVINDYTSKQKKLIDQKDENIAEEKEKLDEILQVIANSYDAIKFQVQNNNLYDQKVILSFT